MKSKCLSCEWFWKTQPDKEKRCYIGGSDGGLIHYCTGFCRKRIPVEGGYTLMSAQDYEIWKKQK